MSSITILLLEGYYGGSHKKWADGLIRHSRHKIRLLSLPARFWKWRMHGGAVTLARRYMEMDFQADLILATDMIDLSLFLALTREKTRDAKVVAYFHENQLTYPWSPQDRDVEKDRDHHYAFINYTNALCADCVLFNSRYHMDSFLDELPRYLKMYPDHRNMSTVEDIRSKSSVLPVGMDYTALDAVPPHPDEPIRPTQPVILWNHRWEYDKGPDEFFRLLYQLDEEGLPFQLIVLGKRAEMYPPVFDEARERLRHRILHWGYAESFERYVQLVRLADLLPVTSTHDFFGISVVEAMWLGVTPLVPGRLAYPEHVGEDLEIVCIYEDRNDLFPKTRQMLSDKLWKGEKSLRTGIRGYEWDEIQIRFDDILQELGLTLE